MEMSLKRDCIENFVRIYVRLCSFKVIVKKRLYCTLEYIYKKAIFSLHNNNNLIKKL